MSKKEHFFSHTRNKPKPLSSRYEPKRIEREAYARAQKEGWFLSRVQKDKSAYTIVMPPPNVTGILHMGHVLNNTIQDMLVRYARMKGQEACWVPGLDHASIATEAKVVALLKEEGVSKEKLGREGFLKRAWAWKEKYGSRIVDQMKRLGLSCDWQRLAFTMDKTRSEQVIQTFIRLHDEGLVYKGPRMVQWDCQARTVLSDEEVYHKEVPGTLYHISYALKDLSEEVQVATTRPETLLGDTALCVHPKDKRYVHLVGKTALVPLVDRAIPIISDPYVDREYGTGCLKITPAHDPNDYQIAQKHKLPLRNILDESGRLTSAAGFCVGRTREQAREEVVRALKVRGKLAREESITHKVAFSERTHVVAEPRVSAQWFLRMKALAQPALDSVMRDEIRFYPAKLKNSYKHWMTHVRDWCISRQLWWGHRIPIYHHKEGQHVAAQSLEDAVQRFRDKGINVDKKDLRQDEDVLDTWFSSWLWPLSVFDGVRKPGNEEMSYYYPTQTLVTAPEIMFFWVARMIMAGYYFTKQKPFSKVYFTGIVRDKQRRKMSKSLGNSPDPIDLIDKHGADGVRMGLMLCTHAGNDLLFDESLCEQGRNFANKVWNALRLLLSWKTSFPSPPPPQTPASVEKLATQWMEQKIQHILLDTEKAYASFRLAEVSLALYKLIKEDFCNHYLEMVKPKKGESLSEETLQKTREMFLQLMKMLHPLMPFLSEEVAGLMGHQKLPLTSYPPVPTQTLPSTSDMDEVLDTLRELRHQLPVSPPQAELYVQTTELKKYNTYLPVLKKLCPLKKLTCAKIPPSLPPVKTFLHRTDNFFLYYDESSTPQALKNSAKSAEADLAHYRRFLADIEKKLQNPKFRQHARPEVVAREEKKKKDTLAKIEALTRSSKTQPK